MQIDTIVKIINFIVLTNTRRDAHKIQKSLFNNEKHQKTIIWRKIFPKKFFSAEKGSLSSQSVFFSRRKDLW